MNTNLTIVNVVGMLLKRWWLILLALIVGATAFYSFNKYLVAPVYTSSGSVYVDNVRDKKSENVNMSDMATSQMLVWTYMELLQSNTYMNTVAEICDLGYSGKEIRSMISMMPKNETEIMEVTAVTNDPMHSQIIVNTILENASAEIDRIIKGGSVEIIDYANAPLRPSGPNILLNTLIGAVLGAVAAAGAVLLLEILDNRVKNDDDLLGQYDFPVLGNIPDIN